MSGLTFRNSKIEISIAGGAWTDVSGATNAVVPSGGDMEIGTFYDAASNRPTLGLGKAGEHDIMTRVKYEENQAAAYGLLEAAYEAGQEVAIRWSPKGSHSGDWLFTSDAGFLKTSPYTGTGQEVQSGDPMRVEFSVTVPGVTRSVVA